MERRVPLGAGPIFFSWLDLLPCCQARVLALPLAPAAALNSAAKPTAAGLLLALSCGLLAGAVALATSAGAVAGVAWLVIEGSWVLWQKWGASITAYWLRLAGLNWARVHVANEVGAMEANVLQGVRELFRCYLGVMLAVLLWPVQATERPLITLSTSDSHDQTTQAVGHIMSQAYARLGYELQLLPLPLRRGVAKANAGDYDGELYRVRAITADFPNLLAVPTPVGAVEFQAFALQPLPLDGWSSLAAYRLGSEMGVKHIEYNTRGMRVSFALKPEQLFLMLKAGRIDVVVLEKNSARLALLELGARGELPVGLQALGVIDRVMLHTFLHRKHEALLPRVDQALRELTAQGLIRSAWAESSQR